MKKNIVLILPDQMRADFIGCYGANFAKTPCIDQLASESALYENALSPSPLCVPARASLLTGHNAIANGVVHNNCWLRPDHEACGLQSWAKILSENGYETIAIGKMHFYPWDIMEGFDKRIIAEDKRHITLQDDYAQFLAENSAQKYHANTCDGYHENKGACISPLRAELQVDDWVAEKTCEYLDHAPQEKPFALVVGFASPHCPYDPCADELALFQDAEMPVSREGTQETEYFRQAQIANCLQDWCDLDYRTFTDAQREKVRMHYSALIHRIDCCVGKVIQSLKENNLYDNTTIIFSSDHGDFVGDYGMVGKHYFYEPSVHIPLLVRDPSNPTPTRNGQIVSLTDIRATILQIAGIPHCETIDSKVLPCYIPTSEPRVIFGATSAGIMVRTQKWKYCRYENGLVLLHDIEQDPQEKQNLAYQPDMVQTMKELDALLQNHLMKAIIKGNAEKSVDQGEINHHISFAERNWERPYPSLKERS